MSSLRDWLQSYVFEQGFLRRYPYYAHLISGLEAVEDPSVERMGASFHRGRYYLHVNIDAMMREPEFIRGILLHEIHHIVLGHLAHPKFFVSEQRDLMQIAQETTANEHIEERLPDPVIWQQFERFGFRRGQSTLQRYEKLCAARAEGRSIGMARDARLIDDHDWEEPSPSASSRAKELLEHAMEAGAEDAERAESEERAEHPEGQIRVKSVRVAGKDPADLIATLTSPHDAPTVALDWRDALRMFVARARHPLPTWSRPNRRFPARIGEVPGRAYQYRPSLRPTLVVAIDTSLSMSEAELSEIARHLRPISEIATIVVVECDAAIARTYRFEGGIEQVKGRGGTDLRPVFEPRFLALHRADGVVFFTDGEGAVPTHPPAVPVLWVLTKLSRFECPWGMRARLVRTASTRVSSQERGRKPTRQKTGRA